MVRVFQDAGYQAERSYEDGVVHLTFPIDADRGRARRRLRARAAQRVALDRPAAHPVLGRRGRAPATTRARSATRCCGTCSSYGFAGPVYPVNPGARHVRGVPAYADIESIPDDVDLAVLAVPADEVAGVVEACRRKRVRGLVVDLRRLRRDRPRGPRGGAAAGRRAPGPRACAWSAPTAWASSTPTPRCGSTPASRRWSPAAAGSASSPSPARSASRCSSGPAAATSGCPRFVSAGNRADVSGNDLLQYWATDPATEVVLLHLESFGNPRKFARLARTRRPDQAGGRGEERPARAA